jgi:hypothetical protein
MARSIWTGSVSFGLVNIPVRVFSAVREHDVHFHQLAPDGARPHGRLEGESRGLPRHEATTNAGEEGPKTEVPACEIDSRAFEAKGASTWVT